MASKRNEIADMRNFLRERLANDFTTFHGHETERANLLQILERTINVGESNSALLIGPRGAGKTTLIASVLVQLMAQADFQQNAMLVKLNGYLHTDDRLALKAITVQMQLENVADGKVFGSFAENLAFLLDSLKSGNKKSKSVIFLLEEFDHFCAHHNQTLLYNLFDVSQSAQAPICVVGITCRLDVIELLEKRVKSRFSHRQIFLFSNAESFEQHMCIFQELLSIPSKSAIKEISARAAIVRNALANAYDLPFGLHFDPSTYKFSKEFNSAWNQHIADLAADEAVRKVLQKMFDYDVSEAFLKAYLLRLVSMLRSETQTRFTLPMITRLAQSYDIDCKVELLTGLSVLGICLIIAIMHHCKIYDRDPFNFEIIFTRFNKFAKSSSSMQGMERAVVLKQYEHLRQLEFILPMSNSAGKLQKDFEMHMLILTFGQINVAVQKYQALPTEVAQWAQSSLI